MTLVIQPPGPGVPNYSQADTPGYGAYAQPFSATAEGLPARSFSMDVLVDPRRFAAAREVTARWAFDMREPISGKPWGYAFAFYGNHEGAIVPGAAKPVAVEKMTRWDIAWDADLQITTGDASLLNDTFLKNAAGASVLEIGVFGRPSSAAVAFANRSKAVGVVAIDGVAWLVYVSGIYVMVLPPYPQLRTKFNMLPLRDFLKAKGMLPSGALFPSTAIGIEPSLGAGSCRVGLTVNVA